ncbi:BREX-1 system adenine-specific DNA-methyltransferase PglX [Paenibacillus sp. BR1-192]|uniref:BREX-1 system adenine-specific DNA-methyltransferase PglX n=1 Tax=Paenibacillus sp. BR1-192 TaxID=3032287 RepID=UPI00240D137A|nr:BREX-1 system adenine-specific DNA-methyltransferase PglX [Paenibacillus sp. BR1-192]WFB59695.1 BREX-1 system adenine-specific DNA-methyltransferase PglX [Paenibacillus sp. BR1-192]
MNKTALKNFATNARKELIEKIKSKAFRIGITEENIKKTQFESSDAVYIDGKQLSATEKKQREKLISRIKEIGYNQVVEEVAYTWFNRFTALRFMEVNNYLPTKVRVLSSSNSDSSEPDIIKDALTVDLDIDKELVYELKINNKTEELFKYLVIKQCNSLNKVLPFMFETIDDYKEILFPEGVFAKDSFIREMTDIEKFPEEDWKQVEIVGWLYQYYIAEEKDRVIKAKKKYTTEEIPFATQLFTPDWIVRYMVQNSLGRYWVESHPEDRDLLKEWEYYLENSNNYIDFQGKLDQFINKELRVEDIKCFDPAMGSGHILVYMFDVLFEIYSRCGYSEREIPRMIIENNLYGLDIDDRAYQLACFSVVMKAMQYYPRFFRSIEREGLQLNLGSIQETNKITEEDIIYFVGNSNGSYYEQTKWFIDKFKNAKTFGSLIDVGDLNFEYILQRLEFIQENPVVDIFHEDSRNKLLNLIPKLLFQAKLMNQTHDILVTNPPYMGAKYMNSELTEFIKLNYPEAKSDTFSAFMYYCMKKVKPNGHLGFLTPFVWMFISAYEQIRELIVLKKNISSLVQLEYNAFPEACVPVSCFTLRNYSINCSGEYIKLSNFTGSENQPIKTLQAVIDPNVDYRFTVITKEFSKIDGMPIAYWISDNVRNIFGTNKKFGDVFEPRQGFYSGDNEKFLRFWYEIDINKFNLKNKESEKWYPYNKGGEYRKWYGNNLYVVDWEDNGREIRNFKDSNGKLKSRPQSLEHMLIPGITWGLISSSKASFRYFGENFLSGHKGPFIIFKNNDESTTYWTLGLLNSKVVEEFLKILSPTIGFEVGHVKRIPLPSYDYNMEQVANIVKQNVLYLKADWDSNEVSWDFSSNPLINKHEVLLENSCLATLEKTNHIRNNLEKNETEINKYILASYGLSDEVEINFSDDDLNFTLDSQEELIKSLMSYFVGCSFGRYSLDEEGLIFAGGRFEPSRYKSINVEKDNVLPVTPDNFLENDIVTRFVEFIKAAFGEEMLEENLDFVADSIGRKKGETAKETIRGYFLHQFYMDHIQTYKKRPIFWLFTSGKQKAFNCLIYMHRYDKSTLSRIRTDYLHEIQIRMDAERKSLLDIINGDGTAKEISNAKKELKSLDLKIEELRAYDEKLHHMADMQIEIDLDDGVAVNYAKFEGLVAPIK